MFIRIYTQEKYNEFPLFNEISFVDLRFFVVSDRTHDPQGFNSGGQGGRW
jgi:hypothetical protein